MYTKKGDDYNDDDDDDDEDDARDEDYRVERSQGHPHPHPQTHAHAHAHAHARNTEHVDKRISPSKRAALVKSEDHVLARLPPSHSTHTISHSQPALNTTPKRQGSEDNKSTNGEECDESDDECDDDYEVERDGAHHSQPSFNTQPYVEKQEQHGDHANASADPSPTSTLTKNKSTISTPPYDDDQSSNENSNNENSRDNSPNNAHSHYYPNYSFHSLKQLEFLFGVQRFVGVVARPIVPTRYLYPDQAPRFTHVPSPSDLRSQSGSDDEEDVVGTNAEAEGEDVAEPQNPRASSVSDEISEGSDEEAYTYETSLFLS